jgi:hypothetical protein
MEGMIIRNFNTISRFADCTLLFFLGAPWSFLGMGVFVLVVTIVVKLDGMFAMTIQANLQSQIKLHSVS